ncbi:hypothetical protein YTPLAS18_32000 [Nitrospira sp.]|nr:hypothetical protein YTPLAS18_32000 [Nitrospira sp.]
MTTPVTKRLTLGTIFLFGLAMGGCTHLGESMFSRDRGVDHVVDENAHFEMNHGQATSQGVKMASENVTIPEVTEAQNVEAVPSTPRVLEHDIYLHP